MTPKEKAKELISIFGKQIGKELKNGSFRYNIEIAKECALIAVDEILNNDNNFFNTYSQNDYWLKVKQEIEKL